MTYPKVTVLITSYWPQSKHYLDQCIASVKNLNYPKEFLEVILVTKEGYEPQYEGVRTIWPEAKEFHNPVGINYGVKHMSPDSKFIFLINDDVICTRDSLKNMVESLGDNWGVLGATSNCDNYWLYSLTLMIKVGDFFKAIDQRFYKYEDWAGHFNELMNAKSWYNRGVIMTQTLCLYANLIPTKLWNEVGGFDEAFKTGFDDTDWCLRARQKGAWLGVSLDALIWHFGGASTSKTITQDERDHNKSYFETKWNVKV